MTTKTEFDHVFDEMSAPNYPSTCNDCGETGTNASMAGHECAELTKEPWRMWYHIPDEHGNYNIYTVDGERTSRATSMKSAELIVRRVNSFDVLVEALDLAAKRLDFLTNCIQNSYGGISADVKLGREYAEEARAALATAKGEKC